MVEMGMLLAAAAVLLRAIWVRHDAALMLGVGLYAAVVFFIVKTSDELIVPAMVLAIALATLGLVRFLRDRPVGEEDAKGPLTQGFFTDI